MPLVLQPRRVAHKSKMMLMFFSTVLSCNIRHSFFDHLIQFVIVEDFMTPKPPHKSNLYKRNFDNFNSNKLKEDLHKIDWINETLKSSNDTNRIFNIFNKTHSEIGDCHAPLSKVTKKKKLYTRNHG